MITSKQNPQVKFFRRLLHDRSMRHEEGRFIAEGLHLVQDALAAGREIESLLVAEGAQKRADVRALLAQVAGDLVVVLSDDCYGKISALKSPEGLAVLLKASQWPVSLLADSSARWIVAAGLQDPGNTGAIVRTAEGAGMTGAILVGACCDILHPAYLRATMGACFRVPQLVMTETEFLTFCQDSPINLCVAHGAAGDACDYRQADYTTPLALAIGAEGQGVPESILGAAKQRLTIPMAGRLESLNAGVAGALLMYESTR